MKYGPLGVFREVKRKERMLLQAQAGHVFDSYLSPVALVESPNHVVPIKTVSRERLQGGNVSKFQWTGLRRANTIYIPSATS